MPWKKLLVSEARVQFVLAAKNRSESFASLCDHFGISRKSGYKWLQRYRTVGVKALADASVGRATEGKCIILCGECGCAKCARSIRVGEQKSCDDCCNELSWAKAPCGGEHVGALACGVAFGEE